MDLWRRVLDAAARHEIAWHWVRGHAGHALNERADQLATAARERLIAGDGG
jgi:ribonuclease HI